MCVCVYVYIPICRVIIHTSFFPQKCMYEYIDMLLYLEHPFFFYSLNTNLVIVDIAMVTLSWYSIMLSSYPHVKCNQM